MFYKEHLKNEFLNQFDNEKTREVYKRVFKKSKEIEEEYDKDVFNFDETLIRDLLKVYKPSTDQSARTYFNILSSYIQWGIDNGYSELLENPLKDSQSYFYTFVEKKRLYLPKSDIDLIISRLVNAQDSFIIQALFEGIQGKEVSELTLLTKEQIEDSEITGKLKLIDKCGNKRVIYPDAKTINLALLALKEEEYYKKNGLFDYIDNLKDVINLPESKYVLKPTATNNTLEDKPVSHYTVYNRLEMIKSLDEFEEFKDALSTKNIVRSGMIYEAKKMMDKGIKIDRKAIESICSKFGISYKWSLKDFLNEETINEVYS